MERGGKGTDRLPSYPEPQSSIKNGRADLSLHFHLRAEPPAPSLAPPPRPGVPAAPRERHLRGDRLRKVDSIRMKSAQHLYQVVEASGQHWLTLTSDSCPYDFLGNWRQKKFRVRESWVSNGALGVARVRVLY